MDNIKEQLKVIDDYGNAVFQSIEEQRDNDETMLVLCKKLGKELAATKGAEISNETFEGLSDKFLRLMVLTTLSMLIIPCNQK